MRRDQLEYAIRAACQIIGHPAGIIVGSQSILGNYRESELPLEATMSIEIDVLPIADDNAATAALADEIEGVAGEWSPFEELHGFSIDGVDLDTAILPAGWHDRLVRAQNLNTAAPSGSPQFVGWCLNPEDLCVAKLCAYRDKDLRFVGAILAAGMVDAAVIADRLQSVPPRHQQAAATGRSWLTSQSAPGTDNSGARDTSPSQNRGSRRLPPASSAE